VRYEDQSLCDCCSKKVRVRVTISSHSDTSSEVKEKPERLKQARLESGLGQV